MLYVSDAVNEASGGPTRAYSTTSWSLFISLLRWTPFCLWTWTFRHVCFWDWLNFYCFIPIRCICSHRVWKCLIYVYTWLRPPYRGLPPDWICSYPPCKKITFLLFTTIRSRDSPLVATSSSITQFLPRHFPFQAGPNFWLDIFDIFVSYCIRIDRYYLVLITFFSRVLVY